MNPTAKKQFLAWLKEELDNITDLDAYALSMDIEKTVYMFLKTHYDKDYKLPGRNY